MDGSAEYTDMCGHRKCTDILIIGKTGNGKSSTGNSILGRRAFVSMASSSSVTKKAQIEYSDVGDRIVKVVDIPGMCDTDSSPTHVLELVINAVQYAVAASPRGYHAILLVVQIGRFTKEDYKAVQQLKGIFGSNFVEKFTIIVMTHGDTFDPEENNVRDFEEWCQKDRSELKTLQNECKNRVIMFDNRTKDEIKVSDQRRVLLTMIDSLSENGERYSDEHFQMAKAGRDRIFIKAKLPVIREESVMEASLIIQQLGKIQLDKPEKQLDRLMIVKRRAECLVKIIIEQDRGTGVLVEVIQNATNISLEIDGQIKTVKTGLELHKQNMKQLDEAHKLCPQQAQEGAKQKIQINITNDAIVIQTQIMQRTLIAEKSQVDPQLYRPQPHEGATKEVKTQAEDNERRTEEMQALYKNVIEQLQQSNERAEKEYNKIVERQNNNLFSKIIGRISDSISKFVKKIYNM